MGFIAKLIGTSTITTTTRKTTNEPKTGTHASNKSRFRGVQVNPTNDNCCSVVRANAGVRFLSNEVPMLPLDGCDAADCQCTYELFDDRRTDFRRTADVAFDIVSQLFTRDKRSDSAPGRRNTD